MALPDPTAGAALPSDVTGGGNELTDGFVGTALAMAALGEAGRAQLIQPIPGMVLLHPVAIKQGKHTRPALIQFRRDSKTRMADSSFLEQV